MEGRRYLRAPAPHQTTSLAIRLLHWTEVWEESGILSFFAFVYWMALNSNYKSRQKLVWSEHRFKCCIHSQSWEEMAIIMSSDSDELWLRSFPVTVDYTTGSAPDSPMSSNVSSVNSNSFIANKDKTLSSSENLKISFVSTNSELNDENVVNKPSLPFSITSILNRGDPISKCSKPESNFKIGSNIFYLLFFSRF